ncbi:MAG: hypothetical protein ACKVQB_08685 [Bacteroidia bacterium]
MNSNFENGEAKVSVTAEIKNLKLVWFFSNEVLVALSCATIPIG